MPPMTALLLTLSQAPEHPSLPPEQAWKVKAIVILALLLIVGAATYGSWRRDAEYRELKRIRKAIEQGKRP
jgi:hypothetical protein